MACNRVNIPPQPEQEKDFTVGWVKWLRKLMDAVKSLQTCVDSLGTSDYFILGRNTYGGVNALASITTGEENIALGEDAGNGITDKSFNVIIGYGAGTSYNLDSSVVIGQNASVSGLNGIAIGAAASAGARTVSIGESTAGIDDSICIGWETNGDNNSILIGNVLDTTGTDDVIKIGDSSHTTINIGHLDLTPATITVTGSRGGNNALGNLLTILESMGLIIDSSTA